MLAVCFFLAPCPFLWNLSAQLLVPRFDPESGKQKMPISTRRNGGISVGSPWPGPPGSWRFVGCSGFYLVYTPTGHGPILKPGSAHDFWAQQISFSRIQTVYSRRPVVAFFLYQKNGYAGHKTATRSTKFCDSLALSSVSSQKKKKTA